MADVTEQLVTILPYLRRYARALVGDQGVGDTYVRICLETLVQEPGRVRAGPACATPPRTLWTPAS
jgi:hypothetical protein